ncbi:MAG: apolipoprotein N-acyltransferase [Verrucomicrobiae bacterium]|nr:apolipoprotein N-acyltransferase [Verrucomicrobiae bacterium]
MLRQSALSERPATRARPARFLQSSPFYAAVLSGVLLTLAFPDWGFEALGWVALMPLAWGAFHRPETAFRQGFVCGLVFFWASLVWLRHVTLPGWLALGCYLALYPAAWSWWLGKLRSRWPRFDGLTHLGIALAGAAAWVALEWTRGHFLTGFGWNGLGVTQYRALALIQIAEYTGIYGLSFLLAFFNLAFLLGILRMTSEKFSAARWRYELTAALALMAVCVSIGARRLLDVSRAPPAHALTVAMIQPNIPQSVKFNPDFEREGRDNLKRLTLQAAAARPDLILWPETALVSGPGYNAEAAQFLGELSSQVRVPMLIGTIDRDADEKRRLYYNSALLVDSRGGFVATYRKRHLVPFGEYVPFGSAFPWLRRMIGVNDDFGEGSGPQVVDFPLPSSPLKLRLGLLICFEDTLPEIARESAAADTDILVNLTNDAWFGEEAAQRQQAAISVFRAVETRKPLLRCTNDGLTCVVRPDGRIVDELTDPRQSMYFAGFKLARVAWAGFPPTFYQKTGDWIVALAALICGGAGILLFIPKAKS